MQYADAVFYRILNLFSRDTYVVDQILARVSLPAISTRTVISQMDQVISNVVRTLFTTLMIVFVIGYSFPLFVSAMSMLSSLS